MRVGDSLVQVVGLERDAALRISQSVVGTTIQDFTLLNRDGQPVRIAELRGKPLLVSFIYTGCMDVCPATTQALQNTLLASQNILGNNQFNAVSIGFNLPDDSPQAMKAFAAKFHINQPNWDFLSAQTSNVESLTQAFGFSYIATPAGFDHISQVTLLDSSGRIYRQLYGDSLPINEFVEPMKQLLNNSPVSKQLNMNGLIDRVRILCTVYDPKTGTYRFQYGLLLEVAGGLTFALTMIWFFLAERRLQRRRRIAYKQS